jgi:carbon storage regulator
MDGAVLVLRRRVGETIAIGGGIEIEVVEISRTRVKLGVKAPRDVSVVRKETIAVAAENRKALELISGGPVSVMETLRLLGAALPVLPAAQRDAKTSGSRADMYFADDIPGIPYDRENPGPA